MSIALAFAGPQAEAAGLGRLTVLSGLGQPLKAEVEVTAVGKDESGSLAARLAPPEAFRQVGLDFNPALQSLRFQVQKRSSGKHVVLISSASPVNEPFVDLLVELSWNGGRLIREYTFLLDPPELKNGKEAVTPPVAAAESKPIEPPVAAAPQPLPGPAASGEATAEASDPVEKPAPAAGKPLSKRERQRLERQAAKEALEGGAEPKAPKQAAGESPAPTEGSVQVNRGDTLAGIASRVKPEGVSLDQMLVALYQANPSAFVGSNMNRLRSGVSLNVPDRGAVEGIEAKDARKQVKMHAANFASFRDRLASSAQTGSGKEKSVGSGQMASGKVGSSVGERSGPAASTNDELRVSRGGKEGKPSKEEARIAREKAVAEAKDRVESLQKNVDDLQKLVELKNKAASEGQKAGATKPIEATKDIPAPVAAAPSLDSVAKEPAAGVSAQPMTPPDAAKPAEPAAAPAAGAAEPPKVPEVPPAPAPMAAEPEQKPAGLVERLTGNPMILAGAAGLAVLAGAGALFAMRKRRKQEDDDDSLTGGETLTGNSLFGETGGQTVDTANSLFGTTAQSGTIEGAATEVDPLAEADVYIAYGRDEQAEEILREALRKTPERHAIRTKLLEILAKRQDLTGFNAVARELRDLTGGRGDDWERAAALGRSVDPSNPLYAGGAAIGQQFADDSIGADSSRLDLNLDTEFGNTATLSEPAPLDFDLAAGQAPASRRGQDPVSANLQNIDLNLDSGSPATLSQPSDPRWQEMATKLDLAAAYEEIGDKEGARELLDEVVRGGDPAQIKKAQEMLANLG